MNIPPTVPFEDVLSDYEKMVVQRTTPRYKKINPTIVLFQGKPWVTSKGKTVWSCVGHAKAAVRYDVTCTMWRYRVSTYDTDYVDRIMDLFQYVEAPQL